MEPSPLTQQERPSDFQPKIAQLYEELFQEDGLDTGPSDGFWREFFLLRPDRSSLRQKIYRLRPSDLITFQQESQQLFSQAVLQLKAGRSPGDEHALDTLIIFLNLILAKRYTNPSADIINVITGLHQVDSVLIDFANTIEAAVANGRSVAIRRKAIDTALVLAAGAYQTSLIAYLTYRDLFPALTKFVLNEEGEEAIAQAFLLLGLLASYNKFEFQNPYRVRLEGFDDVSSIHKYVSAFGDSMRRSRNRYVAIQEDIAEGWTLSNTLTYVGLGVLASSRKPIPAPGDESQTAFGDLPDHKIALLLGGYEFACANKSFCYSLINQTADSNTTESPFSAFLSCTSYLLHHAFRSSRATSYGLLNLLIIRMIIEDKAFCKVLCDPEGILPVRLCRQRPPYLPVTSRPRPSIASIFDILADTINHNLRRNLDLQLYIFTLDVLHRLISYLAFSKTRVAYHWPLMWQTLVSFLRFITAHESNFVTLNTDLPRLFEPLLNTIAIAITLGESFLPDPAAYDDLFYKLIEAGDMLQRFKSAFAGTISYRSEPSKVHALEKRAIDILIHVSAHYQDMVQIARREGGLGNNPSPRQISKIIKQGYESLQLPTIEGLDKWEYFREGDYRGLLKRASRIAADDARQLFTLG